MIPRDPFQVRIAGSGGQGVILAGVLLAEAGMHDGLHVVHTQSYGPEARLGAAKSDVVLSRREIASPDSGLPDVLVCLSREAYARYGRQLAPGGTRIVEAQLGGDAALDEGDVALPILRTARELDAAGAIAANLVALGALLALSHVVTERSLDRALRGRIKPDFLDLNRRALAAGLRLGARLERMEESHATPEAERVPRRA